MAVMRPLIPAIEEALPSDGWKLVALDGGRYATGLQATIEPWNGSAGDAQLLCLADPKSWTPFQAVVAAQVGCTAEEVHSTLLRLKAAIEGQLRERSEQAEERAEHLSQATQLVAMAGESELFHTPEGEAYATITVDEHRETWLLKAKGFRRWLARQFYEQHKKAPGSQAVQDALGVLEGKALFNGPECPVYTRLAEHDGAIYLDLAGCTMARGGDHHRRLAGAR